MSQSLSPSSVEDRHNGIITILGRISQVLMWSMTRNIQDVLGKKHTNDWSMVDYQFTNARSLSSDRFLL